MPATMSADDQNSVSVNVSGPVLACMIYEMMNSIGDQEGFLIGDVVTQRTEGISDSQLNFQEERNIVCIHHCVPCDINASFYDGRGHVDEDAVRDILGSHYKNLIGWYAFRRNTTLDVMFREESVCLNLRSLLPANRKPFHMFGIFTCTANSGYSTHSSDYVFLRHVKRMFQPVPVVVVNLGDTSQMEYKTSPLIFLANNTAFYGDLLKPKAPPARDNSSMDRVRSVQKVLQTKLQEVCRQLHDTERQSDVLHAELQQLKQHLSETNQDVAKASMKNEKGVVKSIQHGEEKCLITWEEDNEAEDSSDNGNGSSSSSSNQTSCQALLESRKAVRDRKSVSGDTASAAPSNPQTAKDDPGAGNKESAPRRASRPSQSLLTKTAAPGGLSKTGNPVVTSQSTRCRQTSGKESEKADPAGDRNYT